MCHMNAFLPLYVCVCVTEMDKDSKRQVYRHTTHTEGDTVLHSLSLRQTRREGVNYGSNDPAMNKPVGGSRAPIRLPSSGY